MVALLTPPVGGQAISGGVRGILGRKHDAIVGTVHSIRLGHWVTCLALSTSEPAAASLASKRVSLVHARRDDMVRLVVGRVIIRRVPSASPLLVP